MPGPIVHSPLTITPSTHTIGAYITGLDFSSPIPDPITSQLKSALHTYGVLIARATNITDESLISLGKQWGQLDNVLAHIKAGRKMRFMDKPEIFDVSNLTPEGEIIPVEDRLRTSSKRGNTLWHADGAYNPRRSGISIIRAVELPPPGTGGETEFLDSRTAYEDLPQAKKEEIKDYVGMNTLLWNRRQANPDMSEFDLDFENVPLSKHPIAQIHEPTGRGNLYVGSYNHHIEGLPVDTGRRITEELMAHVTQDKYRFTVEWLQPGDVAFWDNTAVLHRATVGEYGEKYRRDMRRISTFDDSKWAWGANDPVSAKQVGLT